jgi:hypothetical protein
VAQPPNQQEPPVVQSLDVAHLAGEDHEKHAEHGEQDKSVFRHDKTVLTTMRNVSSPSSRYPPRRRCPSAWWAPPPSKRVGWVIPVRRVRFPSTSATVSLLLVRCTAVQLIRRVVAASGERLSIRPAKPDRISHAQ